MDQKRLFLAIAVSLAILLGFQFLIAPHLPKPPPRQVAELTTPADAPPGPAVRSSTPSTGAAAPAAAGGGGAIPSKVPRVKIVAPKVTGSISLLGARLDDLLLTQYRETIEPEFSRCQAARTTLGGTSLLHPIRLDRRRHRSGEAAGQRHGLERLLGAGQPGQTGDIVLGQRRGPDLPDRTVGGRRLHVHGPPDGAQHHRTGRSSCFPGRGSAATTSPTSPATTCCSRGCWASPTARCRKPVTTRRKARGRRRAASPSTPPPPEAGPVLPTNTG